MKRRFAWLLASASGLYLLTIGPLPDPIPIVDEATALLVFVKSMSFLGYDVTRFLPFFGKGKAAKSRARKSAAGSVVDV